MNNRTRMKSKACERGLQAELRNHFNSPSRYFDVIGEWSVRLFRIGLYSVKGAKNNHA